MDKVDSLFYLIKSLSKAQKRYFKINTPHIINGQNNYMKLFDALESQREYDEEQIIKEFAGETFIKHLPSEKNYLYELILKTMRAYQHEKNAITKLRGMHQDIEFLMENNMHTQAYKKLRKAKKIAAANEEFCFMHELLGTEKELVVSNNEVYDPGIIEELTNEENQAVEMHRAERELCDIYLTARLMEKEAFKPEEWASLMNHPLLSDENELNSFKLVWYRQALNAMHLNAKGLQSDAAAAYRECIAHWQANPSRMEEMAEDFKQLIFSYALVLLKQDDLDGFVEQIAEIRECGSRNVRQEIADLKEFSFFEFRTLVERGKFDRAEHLLQTIEDRLTQYRYLMDSGDQVEFFFYISTYYFIIDEPKKASKWISRIKRLKTEARMDIQVFSCFIEIMAHFNQRKETHMQYIVRNNAQFIKERPRLTHFQTTINKNLTKALKLKSRDQIIDVLFKLRSEMMLYKEAKIESKLVGVDEMIFWIDSQIKDVPIREIFLNKEAQAIG